MTDTNHTDSVEAARKKYVEMWEKGEFEWNHHEGDILGKKPISPERIWQVFIEPTLQATQSQQVEEAVRKERERIDAEVLSPLYEKINSFYEEKHDIVGQGALQIVFEEALQALTPNHQD